MEHNHIKSLADIDDSNAVFITLNNPHYPESIQMDYDFEWPNERIRIIQAIKGAVRMNLKIGMFSNNKEAMKFMDYYYREYACLDYLEEHPEEMKKIYPWLAK